MVASSTWKKHPGSNDFATAANWTNGFVPGLIATFGASSKTHLVFSETIQIDTWVFTKNAPHYVFTTTNPLIFSGPGIQGGKVDIVNHSDLVFGYSGTTAGHATITNFGNLTFSDISNAGNAVITTRSGGITAFTSKGDGRDAHFITKAGGVVDFSQTNGPASLHLLHAGSIEGAGTYHLGINDLTVGSNNRSTTVSGLIDGNGGTLEKAGRGTLKLSHANNTFTGGVVLSTGTLDIAAIGAAGTGNIAFAIGSEDPRGTLKVENAAFSNHVFATEIDTFHANDKLLLPGLKFKPHAKATYDSDLGILTVKSGHVTDTFAQFNFATEGHYKATNDGHGGTKVVVVASMAKADHADSFAFKAETVKAPTHQADATADHQEHVAAYLGGTSESPFAADILPHQLTEFAHHGELFR